MGDWTVSLKQAFTEFRRRRVFRVAAAYLVVSWILVQLGSAIFEPLGLPPWSMRLLVVLLALGFVLACVLAWTYDIGAHGIERTAPAAAPAPAEAPATHRRRCVRSLPGSQTHLQAGGRSSPTTGGSRCRRRSAAR